MPLLLCGVATGELVLVVVCCVLVVVPTVRRSRPRTVGDVSHQDETVRTLRTSIESGQMQHLLFYGPPGTGKTSTILALARDMFG